MMARRAGKCRPTAAIRAPRRRTGSPNTVQRSPYRHETISRSDPFVPPYRRPPRASDQNRGARNSRQTRPRRRQRRTRRRITDSSPHSPRDRQRHRPAHRGNHQRRRHRRRRQIPAERFSAQTQLRRHASRDGHPRVGRELQRAQPHLRRRRAAHGAHRQ